VFESDVALIVIVFLIQETVLEPALVAVETLLGDRSLRSLEYVGNLELFLLLC
jgi:hypothetical protein